MYVEQINDISYIHVVVKYNNHYEVNTYKKKFVISCVLHVFSFEGLNSHKKIIKLLGPSNHISSSIL